MHTNQATVSQLSPSLRVGPHLRLRSSALHAGPVLILILGFFLTFAPSAYAAPSGTQLYTTISSAGVIDSMEWSCNGAYANGLRIIYGPGGSTSGAPWCFGENPKKLESNLDIGTSWTVDGTYYAWFDVNSTGGTEADAEEYYVFYRTGGVWTAGAPEVLVGDGINDTHAIRFEIPISRSTVASTTFDVSWIYYTTASTSPVAARGYFISAIDAVDNEILISPEDQVVFFDEDPDEAGVYRHEFSLTLPEGSVSIGIKTFVCDVAIATGLQDCDLGYYGYGPLISTHINVVTSTAPDSPLFNGSDIWLGPSFSSADCDLNLNPFEESTFSFSGCAGYMLIPPTDGLNQYALLDDQLLSRFPFSYLTQVSNVRDSIYNHAEVEQTAITVTILGGSLTLLSKEMVEAVPYAALIRTFLTAFIWLLLAYALYSMILKVHDNRTHV